MTMLSTSPFDGAAGLIGDKEIGIEAVFEGTAGNDHLTGSGAYDVFDLQAGGEDTARGGGGGDTFNMGGAFDAGDHIDGGPGQGGEDYDVLNLDGDYSAGVVMTPRTLTGVEWVQLAAGHDYNLTFNAHPTDGPYFEIHGENLGAADDMTIDASQEDIYETTINGGAGADLIKTGQGDFTLVKSGGGADTVIGGAGTDLITGYSDSASLSGGGGDDTITFSGELGKTVINGGGGADTLSFAGGAEDAPVVLDPSQVSSIETLVVTGGWVVAENGLAPAGSVINLSDYDVTTPVHFDASQELHADYSMIGSSGDDTLIGGGGADTIWGGMGSNNLVGGGGDDQLHGGNASDKIAGDGGADIMTGGTGADTFVFFALTDSEPDHPDLITDLSYVDIIDLKHIDANDRHGGNQAFHLVDTFTHHRGELTVSYDQAADMTTVMGDVNGDGKADLVIEIDGKFSGFTNFVL